MTQTISRIGDHWPTVILTNVFFIIFAVVFVWLCMLFGKDKFEQGTNLLIATTGALAGWALGMAIAPYSTGEQKLFAEIGQTVSAFASGYLVSKLDRFLEATLFDANKKAVGSAWIRLGLFVGPLVLALLFVFSNRSYFRT